MQLDKSIVNQNLNDIFSVVLDDHSRVILKNFASNDEGYINANYIEASTL